MVQNNYCKVFPIDGNAYLAKDLVVSLGITTERYLWNGKKKPSHWDVMLHPDNKKMMLVGYDALLEEHKNIVLKNIGNPYELIVREPVLAMIKPNPKAYNYFTAYTYNGGEKLPYQRILQYTRAESILAFMIAHTNIKDIRKNFGMAAPDFYKHITNIIEAEKLKGLNKDYEGQLQLDGKFPASYAKLLKRARDYAATNNDYKFFIHPNYGNTSSLKVNDDTEALLNNIYVMNHKPNYTEVHRIYDKFIKGEDSIVEIDEKTGEVLHEYDPANFVEISVATVYGYVAAWENKSFTHKKRSSDKIGYNQAYRPYASLENPHFAGSLISMDDRDLPFKTTTGVRVKAYIAMDVASECFIAHSFHAVDKDMTLVMDCFRDMYQKLLAAGFSQPAEVEVEQHLMSTLKDGLLKEGAVFPHVRFAQAANPQEKSIERAFRRMRYGIDKQTDGWIPRPFARDEANQGRTEDDVKTSYTPQEVIAIGIANINTWNNQLHFDQKKYKGLTRMQVWQQKQNENLLPIRWEHVAKYIGKAAKKTSINRGEIRAFNSLYVLDKMAQTADLENGKELDVYGIENKEGAITSIHIYKNNEYVITASQKGKWQKARIEQTDADKEKIATQQKYTAAFDAAVKTKKNALKKLAIVKNDVVNTAAEMPIQTIGEMQDVEIEGYVEHNDSKDYAAMAIENL
jgi:hypothetical protein